MKKVMKILFTVLFLFGCSAQVEKEDVDDHTIVWLMEEFSKPEDEKIDLLNQKIKEEGFDFQVKVKTVSATESDVQYGEMIQEMYEHQEEVDIIQTNAQMDHLPFEEILYPLDEYLNSEEGTILKEVYPIGNNEDLLKHNGIQYILPTDLALSPVIGYAYTINKSTEALDVVALQKFPWELEKDTSLNVQVDYGVNYGVDGKSFLGYEEIYHPIETDHYYELLTNAVGVRFDSKTSEVYNIYKDEIVLETLHAIYNKKKEGVILKLQWVGDPVAYENENIQYVPMYKERVLSEQIFGNAIASWSDKKEDSLALLTWLMSDPEMGMLMRYGVEGDDYFVASDGRVEVLYDTSWYTPLDLFSNAFTTPRPTGIPQLSGEDLINIFENTEKSPLHGFQFDSSKVETEIDNTTAVVESYSETLFWAKEDYESLYAQLLSDLEEAGIQKIIDEANAQITLWKQE